MWTIRSIASNEAEAVRQLLIAAGWERSVTDPIDFAALVDRSQIKLVAIEEDKVIGFICALTDAMSNGYISMLVVSEHRRRNGIGRALAEAAMSDNTEVTWTLLAVGGDGVANFYEKIGFRRSTEAMERRGKRREAKPRNGNVHNS
jgi:ribosomal protein S18 acetylase RimI-like enzyme